MSINIIYRDITLSKTLSQWFGLNYIINSAFLLLISNVKLHYLTNLTNYAWIFQKISPFTCEPSNKNPNVVHFNHQWESPTCTAALIHHQLNPYSTMYRAKMSLSYNTYIHTYIHIYIYIYLCVCVSYKVYPKV